MNSVTQTGAVSISAVTLSPYIQWILNGHHSPPPDGLSLLIAAAGITATHAVYAFVKWKWFTPKQEQAHA